MSTRFYPRYVKGNPQLRIFLPDWKLVMVKPKAEMPENVVTFKVDPRMTDWDIKNYLENIYKVGVAAVKSRIMAGPIARTKEGIDKGSDYKLAYVSLNQGQTFKWPDLFPEEKFKETMEDYEFTAKQLVGEKKIDPNASKLPTWFM